MRTTVVLSFAIVLMMALLVACGESATPVPPTSTPAPTAVPTEVPTAAPTEAPTAMMEEEPTEAMMEEDGDAMMWEVSDELKAYAAEHAGGPGAIYIGDGNFDALVGPSVYPEFMELDGTDLGDDDGQVPLDAIMDVRWVFESDYYRQLIEKANLTNPTQLTSSGEDIELQHTCINSQLLWCKHQKTYFVPNVEGRTEGQVTINVTSFPELGLAGTDTATLLADGTLSMTEIYGGYVGGEFPTLAVQYIWGLWPDHETHYKVLTNIAPDLDKVYEDELGAQVLMRNWIAGDDQFFFSDKRLENPEDFVGLKTRSHSAELSDWINHMGAAAQFILLGSEFVAVTQVLVYIGAIIVLFLFGIMLTKASMGDDDSVAGEKRLMAGLVAVLLAVVMGIALVDSYSDTRVVIDEPQRFAAVSDAIFSQYIVAFEAVSVLLLAALIGAIVVARKE